MKYENIRKTILKTRYGHYKYSFIPFDVTYVPVFMEYMNKTFNPYLEQFVVVFIDNILDILNHKKGMHNIWG